MDPAINPFSPGAGAPPPELVGRDALLGQADLLFRRVKARRSEKSLLLTGLRGVGKTVLLNVMERRAQQEGYQSISFEAFEGKALGGLLLPHLRRLLFELDRREGARDKVRRAMAVLRGFLNAVTISLDEVTFGLDIDPEIGTADSGDLSIDLPNLFVAVAEAAEDRQTCVALFIDEIQYLTREEIGALIMAMHKIQQRQLPLVLVGAGLPGLPGLAGESKSYAERLFHFPDVGPLSVMDARRALREPVREFEIDFEDAALDEIHAMTKGYPYFIQEWGYQIWNLAASSPIEVSLVKTATALVVARLDANFFRVRYERLTMSERRFLRAMAALGAGPHRTSDITDVLGVKSTSQGPVRASLIRKGMIYSPSYGEIAFTVPLFDAFMQRAMPDSPFALR